MKLLLARRRGFTMIEMAIVLVVIALVAAGAVTALLATLERQNVSTTEQRLDTLQQALSNYAAANGYLPCPADPIVGQNTSDFGMGYGTGSTAPGKCLDAVGAQPGNLKTDGSFTFEGMVPTKTLGLDDSYAIDGWGYRIMYAVDQNLTAANAMNSYAISSNMGSITILDDTGVGGDPNSNFRAKMGNTNLPGAAYALVSYGGGQGGYPASGGTAWLNTGNNDQDTRKTCHCNPDNSNYPYDATYVQKWTTNSTAGGNDNFKAIVRFARFAQVLPTAAAYNASSSSCLVRTLCNPEAMADLCPKGFTSWGDPCQCIACPSCTITPNNQCPAGYSSSGGTGRCGTDSMQCFDKATKTFIAQCPPCS